jgi:transposase, IS5 family
MGQRGFWDVEKREAKLAKQSDLLLRLDRVISWEEFRPILSKIHDKKRKSKAGRKPIDEVILFKMLILQQLYNISDNQIEYQVNDRISFMKFLHLGIEDRVPDATTVWLFREQLTKAGLIEGLFRQFGEYLKEQGYEAKRGQIIDATIIPVPKQRNSRAENAEIKADKVPEEWKEKPDKLSQKDTDSRWTKKNGEKHYGYKNHISVDVEHGLIREYEVTSASVHDSQVIEELLDEENEDKEVWADSAYRSEKIEEIVKTKGFVSEIHERSYRNQPLSEEQNAKNQKKSKTRARVEHVFGSWVNEMGGKLMRLIGKERISAAIGMKNLTFNMKRYAHLQAKCV